MKTTNVSDNNSGRRNSGDYNSGDYNSGDRNSGDCNSGDWNSGYGNSGYGNSGDRNSGYGNSGDRNSGDYNSGDWNSGAFNRDSPKMRLFEKDLDITVKEFHQQYDLSMRLELTQWVTSSDMTNEEKAEYPNHETTGGYLKENNFKDACIKWWAANPREHRRFLSLPNFDPIIFEEITGITTVEPTDEAEPTLKDLFDRLLKTHDLGTLVNALAVAERKHPF